MNFGSVKDDGAYAQFSASQQSTNNKRDQGGGSGLLGGSVASMLNWGVLPGGGNCKNSVEESEEKVIIDEGETNAPGQKEDSLKIIEKVSRLKRRIDDHMDDLKWVSEELGKIIKLAGGKGTNEGRSGTAARRDRENDDDDDECLDASKDAAVSMMANQSKQMKEDEGVAKATGVPPYSPPAFAPKATAPLCNIVGKGIFLTGTWSSGNNFHQQLWMTPQAVNDEVARLGFRLFLQHYISAGVVSEFSSNSGIIMKAYGLFCCGGIRAEATSNPAKTNFHNVSHRYDCPFHQINMQKFVDSGLDAKIAARQAVLSALGTRFHTGNLAENRLTRSSAVKSYPILVWTCCGRHQVIGHNTDTYRFLPFFSCTALSDNNYVVVG